MFIGLYGRKYCRTVEQSQTGFEFAVQYTRQPVQPIFDVSNIICKIWAVYWQPTAGKCFCISYDTFGVGVFVLWDLRFTSASI